MYKSLDSVFALGIFTDPHVVYESTPQELSAVIDGYINRERTIQRAESIRAGTICAAIYNSRRTKTTDKLLKWTDFFADGDDEHEQTADDIETKLLRLKRIHNTREAANNGRR